MLDKTPDILIKLRELDLKDTYEVKQFLDDLVTYQGNLLKDLSKIDKKIRGADDLLPAMNDSLRSAIKLSDSNKILDLYNIAYSQLDDSIDLGGEQIYALTNLYSITLYIMENKHQSALFVLCQSLAKGLRILDKTAQVIRNLSEKEPKKYASTKAVLDSAIGELTTLHEDIKAKIGVQSLPKDYFKQSFQTFQDIMAKARNKVDDRSTLRKIFDSVARYVSHAVNKFLKSFHNHGFFKKSDLHYTTEKEYHLEMVNIVDETVINGLEEGGISSSFYPSTK